eukprot:355902-Chlamydomonas_euryale.AAC.3
MKSYVFWHEKEYCRKYRQPDCAHAGRPLASSPSKRPSQAAPAAGHAPLHSLEGTFGSRMAPASTAVRPLPRVLSKGPGSEAGL